MPPPRVRPTYTRGDFVRLTDGSLGCVLDVRKMTGRAFAYMIGVYASDRDLALGTFTRTCWHPIASIAGFEWLEGSTEIHDTSGLSKVDVQMAALVLTWGRPVWRSHNSGSQFYFVDPEDARAARTVRALSDAYADRSRTSGSGDDDIPF